MKNLICIAVLVLILGACTNGSPHGYAGKFEASITGVTIDGVPTILQEGETVWHSEYAADGSCKDMPSTLMVSPDGTIKATGCVAAFLVQQGL